MSDLRQRWEEYNQLLEKRAMERPVGWVTATTVFAFFAGLNTICALFGRSFLPYFSVMLAVYAVGTTYICVALFAFTLIRVLRKRKKSI